MSLAVHAEIVYRLRTRLPAGLTEAELLCGYQWSTWGRS